MEKKLPQKEVNHNRMGKTYADTKDKYFDLIDLLTDLIYFWFCSDQAVKKIDEREYSIDRTCRANPQVSIKSRLKIMQITEKMS